MNKEIVVTEEIVLLELLSKYLNGYSNKKIKQLIKYDNVLLNDKIVHNCNILLQKNDQVKIINKEKKYTTQLDIVYEDKDIIVVNKPAGLLSISNRKEKEKTAYHLMSDYVKQSNKNNKIYVVHRLDEQTSGILMFAKNKIIQDKLQTKWNDLVKERIYYAIIPGKTKEQGTIESYLTMGHNQIVHSTKNTNIGNYAKTNYELVKYNNEYSLLKLNIETGRRNQIRVHLKETYNPIIGDKKYGSKINPINRLCLHASKLSLIDPRTNKIITFETNIPRKMLSLLK